jgi:hypothetical protein
VKGITGIFFVRILYRTKYQPMKNYLLLLFPLIFSITLRAQTWQWLKPTHEKGPDYNSGTFTRYSPAGNVLRANINAGASTIGFYDGSGLLLWKKQINNLSVSDVCFDQNENIYFSGSFTGTLSLSDSLFYSAGQRDAILFITSNQGALLKHRVMGGADNESLNSVALGANGIYVGGTFNSAFTIDGNTFTQSGAKNSFIIKFSMALGLQNAFQTESTCCGGSYVLKIAVAPDQSLYLLAYGDSYVKVGNDTAFFHDDGQFACKFSPDLQLQWTRLLISHFMSGTYLPFIKFDAQQNPVMIYRGGGGGGSTRTIMAVKLSGQGAKLWEVALPMNYDGIIDSDQDNGIWAAGNYTGWTAHICLSVVKLDYNGQVVNIVRDSTVSHYINGFAVKDPGSFYLSAKCRSGALGGFSCVGEDSTFLAYYTFPMVLSNPNKSIEERFSLFPNPSSGKVSLFHSAGQFYSVKVYNSSGAEVRSLIPASSTEIDLENEPPGLYLFKISSAGNTVFRKLVVN